MSFATEYQNICIKQCQKVYRINDCDELKGSQVENYIRWMKVGDEITIRRTV